MGARGHAGAELIRLVPAHPSLELAFVSSRELDGQRVNDHVPEYLGDLALFADRKSSRSSRPDADAMVLALPNGKAAAYVEAIAGKIQNASLWTCPPIIVSTSVVLRPAGTDPARLRGERHISNPGCYATAMQLAIAPLKDLAAPPACFGVSGYSGAGTTPRTGTIRKNCATT